MKVFGYKTEDEARKHVKVYENDYNELLDDPNGYHWLLQYPATILDHSIYVFHVPPDASADPK